MTGLWLIVPKFWRRISISNDEDLWNNTMFIYHSQCKHESNTLEPLTFLPGSISNYSQPHIMTLFNVRHVGCNLLLSVQYLHTFAALCKLRHILWGMRDKSYSCLPALHQMNQDNDPTQWSVIKICREKSRTLILRLVWRLVESYSQKIFDNH